MRRAYLFDGRFVWVGLVVGPHLSIDGQARCGATSWDVRYEYGQEYPFAVRY